MNEPRRLIEQNDDFERDLIRSAHGDGPSERAFRRTLVSLGVGLSAMPAAVAGAVPGAAAVGSKLGAVVLAQWLFTGVALGVVTAGGVGLTGRVLDRPSLPAPAVATRTHSARPSSAVLAAHESVAATPTSGPALDPEPVRSVPLPRRGFSTGPGTQALAAEAPVTLVPAVDLPVASASSASESSGTLELLRRETSLLDRARGALARGDAASALTTLEQYNASMRGGLLGPEARVLEVRALLANGQHQAAEKLAKRIIAEAPRSEHADVVRTLLERASNR